jgi:Mg2+ and Co2+ transporter CorA
MLNSFANESVAFFGEDYRHWAHELTTEYLKVEEKLDDRKEMVVALRGTNDSLLAGKTSTAMRSLTTLSIPIFLATLTAAIFSMRPEAMPLVGHTYGFWFILGIIFLVSVGTGIALKFYRRLND